MPRDGRDGRDGKDGIDGKDGRDGVHGRRGESAFDLALEYGFVGTRKEFLDSLHGRDGQDGIDGLNGKEGPRGPQGPKGDIGPMPKHEWRGTELRFQLRDGEWGKYVDLKGDKGEAGEPGKAGAAAIIGGGSVVQTGNSYMPVGF